MIPETRYARSGNLHIAYQVAGDGPVDLVFIHGWIYPWLHPANPLPRPLLGPLLTSAVYTALLIPILLPLLRRMKKFFAFRSTRPAYGARRT